MCTKSLIKRDYQLREFSGVKIIVIAVMTIVLALSNGICADYPTAIVREYLKSLWSSDFETVWNYFSPELQKVNNGYDNYKRFMRRQNANFLSHYNCKILEIKSEKVDNNKINVTCSIEYLPSDPDTSDHYMEIIGYELVKTKGQWKINNIKRLKQSLML